MDKSPSFVNESMKWSFFMDSSVVFVGLGTKTPCFVAES